METITIFTAGASRGNPGSAAIGVYILDGKQQVVAEVAERIGNATDNFAEYQAVMRSLQITVDLFGAKTKEMEFELNLSNELVKKQLNGEAQINDPGLVPYFIEIYNLKVEHFPNLVPFYISAAQNKEADKLVKKALDA